MSKSLVEAGRGYAVLPLSACAADTEAGQPRYAPICEPEISHQIGVAATAQLEVPRELAAKIGVLIRDEVTGLVKSGLWQATIVQSPAWDPNFAEPQQS